MKNQPVRTCAALLLLAPSLITATQLSAQPAATPVDPIPAILKAFQTHDVVSLTDPHGNALIQAFVLSLLRDPTFPTVVDDIVMETASARYQDALDRFVRGDDVPREVLRRAWEDHTVANVLGVQSEEMTRAVRAINASLGGKRKLRIIAGDPPIDWDNITNPGDGRRWIELRDSYPADLVRRQVLDRGRRALLIYGQGHLQRRQIASNYDMSTWQSQTVVSLLERDHAARVFNVWTFNNEQVRLPDEVASWRVPSLAMVRGTTLGAMDFETYSAGFGLGRFSVRDDQLVPLPRETWQLLRMEDQFDAVLYLGQPSTMSNSTVPRDLCQDSDFVTRRLERLTRFGPKQEIERFKKACGI